MGNTLEDTVTAMFYESDTPVEDFLSGLSFVMTRLIKITALEQPTRVGAIMKAVDKYPEDLLKQVEKLVPDIRKQMQEGT